MDPVLIKRRKPINRKTKLKIVFDEKDRREFLTGFHKRKLERKKKAAEELNERLKKEKQRIKREVKNSREKLQLSWQPIPEVEELLRSSATNYDYGDHSVSVVELTSDYLQKKNSYIGENKVLYEEDKKVEDKKVELNINEEVPGMELTTKKQFKKALMKKATSEMQNSKLYQFKNKLNRQQQKKKAAQERRRNKKIMMKSKKGKKIKN